MISAHLPALQVVVPLIAAPMCMLLRGRDWAWRFSLAVTWVTFLIACLLLVRVLNEGTIIYELGGWQRHGESNTASMPSMVSFF